MKHIKIIWFAILITVISFLNIYAQNIGAKNEKDILDKYQNNKKVKQLIYVEYISGSDANLKMYIKDKKNNWTNILETSAFIGKNGIGKEKEGDFKTPIGDFNVTKSFGIKKNPGTSLKYVDVTESIYACDEKCKYYNKIINIDKIKHICKGEHLIEFIPKYNYGMCFDFNKKNKYPEGSCVFVHVKGSKNYTAGCIAIDEESMITLLKNSTTKTKICIH